MRMEEREGRARLSEMRWKGEWKQAGGGGRAAVDTNIKRKRGKCVPTRQANLPLETLIPRGAFAFCFCVWKGEGGGRLRTLANQVDEPASGGQEASKAPILHDGRRTAGGGLRVLLSLAGFRGSFGPVGVPAGCYRGALLPTQGIEQKPA